MEQQHNEQENKPKKGSGGPKIPLPKGPKFNYYWIYGIIAVLLLGLQLFSFQNSVNKEINWQTFESTMLKTHDVEKVAVVNKEIVEVFIKKASLSKPEFKEVSLTSWGSLNPGPHYYFTIGSVDAFEANMKEAQKDFTPEQNIGINYETRRNWTRDLIGWLLPIVILVAVWIFIMRRVSGGAGGPGGQIFSIGKSKATLFDGDVEEVDIEEIQKAIKWQDNGLAYYYYSKDEKFCNKLVLSAANSELMYFTNESPEKCKCNAGNLKALKDIKVKAIKAGQ
jgi:cell division protease FtsH